MEQLREEPAALTFKAHIRWMWMTFLAVSMTVFAVGFALLAYASVEMDESGATDVYFRPLVLGLVISSVCIFTLYVGVARAVRRVSVDSKSVHVHTLLAGTHSVRHDDILDVVDGNAMRETPLIVGSRTAGSSYAHYIAIEYVDRSDTAATGIRGALLAWGAYPRYLFFAVDDPHAFLVTLETMLDHAGNAAVSSVQSLLVRYAPVS